MRRTLRRAPFLFRVADSSRGSPAQQSQRLDLAGLRHHVDGLDRHQLEPALDEHRQIAGERGRIARQVDEGPRRRVDDGFDGWLVGACGRWVEDDGVRFLRAETADGAVKPVR